MMKIVKSPNDIRTYRHVKLDNDLQVLLVSDPSTTSAAASLSVNIGSHNETVEGIAHLLEHMLLSGNDENQFSRIVSENCGISNAYTSGEETCYYFNCVSEGLFDVLNIFAQLFISPLFNAEAIRREINIIDSEYRNLLSNNAAIFSATIKQFMNQNHPCSKYSAGCLETLDIPDIREKLFTFYNTYYSSHLMKMVVVGKESLDELGKYIVSTFSKIPKKQINTPSDFGAHCVPPYNPPIYGKICTKKDTKVVNILWQYELADKYRFYHLDTLLCRILSQREDGTIPYLLRKKHLINGFVVKSDKIFDNIHILRISIGLTDDGYREINYIRAIIINYVKMISKSSFEKLLGLYNELKRVTENEFSRYEMKEPLELATSISSYWTKNSIEPTDLVYRKYIYGDYDLDVHSVLQSILHKIVDSNSIVFVSAQSFDDCDNCDNNSGELLTEKWFGSKYYKSKWIPIDNEIECPSLRLPELKNVRCDNGNVLGQKYNSEDIVRLDIPNIDLWWKCDTSFGTPDINFILSLTKYNENVTVKDKVLFKLFFKYFDVCTKKASAEMIQISNGFLMMIRGYPQEMPKKIKFLLTFLCNSKDHLNEVSFNRTKMFFKKKMESFKFEPLYDIIQYELEKSLVKNCFSIEDQLLALDEITFDDFKNYTFFDRSMPIKVYGLIQGNISKKNATCLGSYVSNKFNVKNVTPKFYDIFENTNRSEFFKTIDCDKETNFCHLLSIRIGYLTDIDNKYLEIKNLLMVLDLIVGEQYFYQLRTKEHLGYVVRSYQDSFSNYNTSYTIYNFLVHSNKHKVEYLKDRTISFIKNFRNYLMEKSEKSINDIIERLIQKLENPSQTLYESTLSNFDTITHFATKEDHINCLKNINKDRLVKFYNKYFTLESDTYWSMNISSCPDSSTTSKIHQSKGQKC